MRLRVPIVFLSCLVVGAAFVCPAAASDEPAVRVSPESGPAVRAASDFNRDGWGDLAAGKANGNGGAGLVDVVYGGADGLEEGSSQTLKQGIAGMPGTAAASDDFGAALAWGDFNGDGYGDLAIGAPYDAVASLTPGTVTIVYGSHTGLDPQSAVLFSANSDGVAGAAASGNGFGGTLATGDFGFGHQDDLAVGVSGDSVPGGEFLAGSFTVLYGSPQGIGAAHSRSISAATKGVKGPPSFNGYMSRRALAAGDFGRDAFDDLAVGAPGEDVVGVDRAGALHVFYGSPTGLKIDGNKRFIQGAGGLGDVAEDADHFSDAVAAGDFGKTSYDDLAVATSLEDNEGAGVTGAGTVFVLYGSAGGLTGMGSKQLWRGANGMPGTPANGDYFGTELAAGNLGKRRQADLAIGSPDVGVGGCVVVVYGARKGLKPGTAREWTQDTTGIWDQVEAGDYFGNALAIANFGGDGHKDLAIGVHSEDFPGFANAGLVQVIYGSADGLVASGNQFLAEGIGSFPGPMEVNGFLPDVLA